MGISVMHPKRTPPSFGPVANCLPVPNDDSRHADPMLFLPPLDSLHYQDTGQTNEVLQRSLLERGPLTTTSF